MSGMHVLGIGSPLGDDQAGWLTVDALRGLAGASGFEASKLDRPGSALVPLLGKAEWVVLVDAMQSGESPGHIRHFDRQDWPAYTGGLSSHGLGVADALALATQLGELPARLDLYGIEIASTAVDALPALAVVAAAQELARRIAATWRACAAPGAGRVARR